LGIATDAAGDAARRSEERMRVGVVMEDDLPGEGARGQSAVLRIGPGAAEADIRARRVVVPAAGVLMVAVGAPPPTVRVALLLVAEPEALVTTARNMAPLSPLAAVKLCVALVAPEMLAPFLCH
jgi:hypothetical protein